MKMSTRLYAAARAAENWKKHGDAECANRWHNYDGYG